MLDEKKIEAIVDSNVNLVCDLVPDSPIVNYKDSLKNLMISCIKKGIELTFEDLWHDARTIPHKDGLILVEMWFDGNVVYVVEEAIMVNFDSPSVNRWLYLDDLFYNQKGDEK